MIAVCAHRDAFNVLQLSNIISICLKGGGRFMADLLVTSMMADGGLEAAFEASLLGKSDRFQSSSKQMFYSYLY
jgi:hypothetical protein